MSKIVLALVALAALCGTALAGQRDGAAEWLSQPVPQPNRAAQSQPQPVAQPVPKTRAELNLMLTQQTCKMLNDNVKAMSDGYTYSLNAMFPGTSIEGQPITKAVRLIAIQTPGFVSDATFGRCDYTFLLADGRTVTLPDIFGH